MVANINIDIKTIIIAVLCILFAWQLFKPIETKIVTKTSIEYRDSLVYDTIIDTIVKTKLVYKDIIRHDTIIKNDSIFVPIPISRYIFQDSTYKFVVEGWNVRPISLEIYPKTLYREKIINTVSEITKQKRISHGIIMGAGLIYGTKGLDVGFIAGYGVTINF